MTIEDVESARPSNAVGPERLPKLRRRAGFWRRLIAFLIDYLIIFVPLFVLVAAVFSLTNGGITSTFFLTWKICHGATLNEGSDLPAADYDWKLCRTSAFGLTVAQWAQGSPKIVAQSDNSSSNSSTVVVYAVDSQGNFRSPPLDVSFVQWIALFIYLLLMEKKSGSSLGKRIMSIAVHDNYDIDRTGLPSLKAFERQGAKFFGLLPAIFLQAWYAFEYWGVWPENMASVSVGTIIVGFASASIAGIWFIWISVSIVRTGNPVHDQFAATSVRLHSK